MRLVDSPFLVMARYKLPNGSLMTISAQLYKVDDRNYLLDFKGVDEGNGVNVIDLFTVCSKLITELAISS